MSKQIIRPETQYLNALGDIYYNGKDTHNSRTGDFCRTLINVDLTYDVSTNKAPLITTRKAPTKLPIAELLGYIRGYTSAEDFRKLGTSSWDANANANKDWLNNPYRDGEDDMGMVYGAVAKGWPCFLLRDDQHGYDPHLYYGFNINLFQKVYGNIKKGIDDRGEISSLYIETVNFIHPTF